MEEQTVLGRARGKPPSLAGYNPSPISSGSVPSQSPSSNVSQPHPPCSGLSDKVSRALGRTFFALVFR